MHLSSPQASALGAILCTVTRNVLWQPVVAELRARRADITLRCRVGAGQATYHRFDAARNEHQITFGRRMILAKHQPGTAIGWLSSREISDRGYYGGQLSTLNLLAHTCCHEFAHLLQHAAGQRRRGSVHNRHFYEILDRLHQQGEALVVRDEVMRQAQLTGLTIPDTPFHIASPKDLLARWQVGDRVAFGARGTRRQGVIEQINRKTATVRATGENRQDLRYRVPASLLDHPGV